MSVLIVMRLADMYRIHPGQIGGACNRCGHTVSIYPSGQAAIKKIPELEVVCNVCYPPEQADVLIPAPGALREPSESEPRK